MGAIVEAVGGVGKMEPWDKVNEKEDKEEKERKEVKENQQRGNVDDESIGKEVGCWDRLRFRFTRRCISSRSKVDSSVSGSSANCGNCPSVNLLFCLESSIPHVQILCNSYAYCSEWQN
ncbi:hypothetical protein SAY86_002489 [Trapa natans]|uniref:Uncharacterized protein n=1 Tax=Trapa natans TaxID=22666 RepID=A0AAN7LR31_TRANT|nr:hypothetical protein SAY86_002489 [Trapa natans]